MQVLMTGDEMIEPIQNRIEREEFDYQTLLDVLKDYARPRDKISDLMRKGAIVRIKKGLYVLGENYRRRPYSRELLANLIYGPSYISLDSALQYYGIIPEHVEAVTSVTTGRSRKFHTPVGLFAYRQIPLQAFRFGMTRVDVNEGLSYLIATPEKSLSDKIHQDRGTAIQNWRRMQQYLVDDLRIDESALTSLNPEAITNIAGRYGSRKIHIMAELVRRLRR
jgi:predicted transcriptional regulator of viral defense system